MTQRKRAKFQTFVAYTETCSGIIAEKKSGLNKNLLHFLHARKPVYLSFIKDSGTNSLVYFLWLFKIYCILHNKLMNNDTEEI